MRGHFERGKVQPTRWLREFRVDEQTLEGLEEGQQVSGEIFAERRFVDVIGTSKGRGFTGVMKRHNFAGKSRSHGTHEYFRHGGSIGASATPSRVFKNRGMPGQYGNEQVTVQKLQIVRFMEDRHLLLVKGAVPGPNGGILLVQVSKKHPKGTGNRS